MVDSCGTDKTGLITIEQALKIIKESIFPEKTSEHVALKNSLGRISSVPIYSPINIPPERNSAMDGYALSSTDIKQNQTFTLKLTGISWAGKPYNKNIKSGECIRVFTGATMPSGSDTVVMQEQVTELDDIISFPASIEEKQNVRAVGSDIHIDAELLPAANKITAVDIGLMASAGISELTVRKKINIGFFSTGDELSSLGQNLESGQIYDSNRYALNALLCDNNCHIHDLGVIEDNKQILEQTLHSAAKSHDVVITTGGASVGDADYIQEILKLCGEVVFWKIAIKPGKPLAFGKIGNCYFFGLPGNPVSVIATYHKIVAPALQYLSGENEKKNIQIMAVCTSNLKKQKGRQEYQRGILTQQEPGKFNVKSAGKQGSHIMSAMSKANCYIVLPIECSGVSAGEQVVVEPFSLFT